MIQLLYIFWDPKPEIFILPVVHYPILWYGVLFALGFVLGFPIFVGILERFFRLRPEFEAGDIKGESGRPNLHKQAAGLADKLTIYMVVATVLGARLGHLIFYEAPSYYLSNPLQILAVWKGGLSSHGAAVGIVLVLGYFSYRFRKEMRHLTWLGLLDFVCVPTALAGACIRVGNFFNQEVLGVVTSAPWAIVFGHPADHSLPAPRHPVQLYEAVFYLIAFLLLWRLTFLRKFLVERGRLLGLFLVLIFGFRIIVEHWKLEQSVLMPFAYDITMGQILSVPAVLVGFWLYFRKRKLVL